jgi:predicted lipid-binding transport protein (Tim44 family)
MGTLWGALVVGVGALMISTFSGVDVDVELAGIITLLVIGGWLLASALISNRSRNTDPAFTHPTAEPHATSDVRDEPHPLDTPTSQAADPVADASLADDTPTQAPSALEGSASSSDAKKTPKKK